MRNTATENLLKAIDELSAKQGGGAVPVDVVLADLGRPRTFADALASALRRQWVTLTPDPDGGRLALTDGGRAQSVRLVRAHELWERYLRQEVGLDADHVHDAAEWVEHYLSEDKVGELDALLAKSTRDSAAGVG